MWFSKIKAKSKLALAKLQEKFVKISQHPDSKYVLIILILGLTPLLWYKPGFIALGHDMGFPLDPNNWFERRQWTWNESGGLGESQAVLMAGLILHGIEALFYSLSLGNIFLAQKLTYIIWFVLPGLAAYFFISRISTHHMRRYMGLIAATLYMFNLFMLQGWFIAERNKFAILTILPILCFYGFKVAQNKIAPLKAAFWLSIALFILNGGGSLPLFGSLIVTTIALIVILIRYYSERKSTWNLVKFFGLFGLFFLLSSAFWLLPQIYTIRTGLESGISEAGGLEGVVTWISEISSQADYISLMRMEGFPDWSETHVYGPNYLNNYLLIIASFVFLFVSLYGAFRTKKHGQIQLVLLGLLILILGTIFSAGNNGIFGEGYIWMIEHLPMFILFRTPFYKFGGAIVFAYAILFPIGVVSIYTDFKDFMAKRNAARLHSIGFKTLEAFVATGTILGLLIYTYPFLSGSFFNWNPPISTMVKVPNYVYKYATYVDQNPTTNINGRTLLVPALGDGSGLEVTTWNFFSLDNVPSLITDQPYYSTDTSARPGENDLLKVLYKKLYENKDHHLVRQLFDILGIESILYRKDVSELVGVRVTDPVEWEPRLNNNPLLRKEIKFDDWMLYEVKSDLQISKLYNRAQIINAKYESFEDLYHLGYVNDTTVSVFENEKADYNADDLKELQSKIATREIISLTPDTGNIANGSVIYDIPARFDDKYKIITKPYDLTELWYKLNASQNGDRYSLTLQRPQTEVKVNDKEVKTSAKSQTFTFRTPQRVDRIVLNADVFTVGKLESKAKYVDHVQPGTNQLTISHADSKLISYNNLALDDPSFESGTWGGFQICGGTISTKNVNARRIKGGKDGDFSVELSSSGPTTACLIQSIKNVTPDNIYRITFNYRNAGGYPLRYCVLQREIINGELKDLGCVVEGVLEKNTKWKTHSVEFLPQGEMDHILHFYTDGQDGLESTNIVDNVIVQQIPVTSVGAFILDTGIEGSQFFNIPNQSFEDIGSADLAADNTIELHTAGGNITSSYLDDGSFEKTVWGGANFCGGDKILAKLKLTKIADATDGKDAVKLSGLDGVACVYTPIINFRPSLLYKITFDYKNISGPAAQFCALVRTRDGAVCNVYEELEAAQDWKQHTAILSTDKNALGVLLHLYSPGNTGVESVNAFDNVKIEVVYNPLQNVYLVSDFVGEVAQESANVNIDKVNATNYNLILENVIRPQVLALNNGYDSSWQIVPEKNSFFLNAYQDIKSLWQVIVKGEEPDSFAQVPASLVLNGWIIENDGQYRIQYLPQAALYLGMIISFGYWFIAILVISAGKLKPMKLIQATLFKANKVNLTIAGRHTEQLRIRSSLKHNRKDRNLNVKNIKSETAFIEG